MGLFVSYQFVSKNVTPHVAWLPLNWGTSLFPMESWLVVPPQCLGILLLLGYIALFERFLDCRVILLVPPSWRIHPVLYSNFVAPSFLKFNYAKIEPADLRMSLHCRLLPVVNAPQFVFNDAITIIKQEAELKVCFQRSMLKRSKILGRS